MSDPFSLVGSSNEGRYRIDAIIGEGGFGVAVENLFFDRSSTTPIAKVDRRDAEKACVR